LAPITLLDDNVIPVSVILPALNEAEALPVVIEDLRAHLPSGSEIIVVDDGSTDDTAAVAASLNVEVVSHSVNRGKGAAMASGVNAAKSEYLLFMDADATYPASAIPELLEMLMDHDIVRGERPLDSQNIPALNRYGNRAFNSLLASLFQLDGRDLLSGLYGMKRSAFEVLELEAAGFDIEVEIAIKAKQRRLDVGNFRIEYRSRVGDKKLRPVKDGLNILSRILGIAILYSPTLTFVIPGALIMLFCLVGAVMLSGGPLLVGGIGLSINSFVLAMIGMLGGFQLFVFGVAAMLYRVEIGVATARWVSRLAGRGVRLGTVASGSLVSLVGGIWIASLILGWIGSGSGSFLETDRLVAGASLFVFGLQLMSAGLFLSIFSGRISRHG
jgi:hypothetical protein